MFKYKAFLRKTNEEIAKGQTIKEIKNHIIAFKRGQKRGEHTYMNVPVDIYEIIHDATSIGKHSKKLILTV